MLNPNDITTFTPSVRFASNSDHKLKLNVHFNCVGCQPDYVVEQGDLATKYRKESFKDPKKACELYNTWMLENWRK